MPLVYTFYLLIFLPLNLIAQDTTSLQEQNLIIGITPTPPFIVENNGDYSGLSISSWQLVNRELGADYEFRSYPSLTDLMAAVEKNEVDFSINPITVTNNRMQRISFSQPYFISYTGIAQRQESSTWAYIQNIVSWNFISAILILLGVIFLFGVLVWIFERRANQEEFGGGLRGVFQGFWWSAVTMTTVGYGDKSPKTLGGRIVGFIWMFAAIIMISSLTAGIASSLTVHNINEEINSIQDLSSFDVVTVENSSAHELLDQYGVQSSKVQNEQEGMQALLDEEATFFIYDQPILRYEIDRRDAGDELEVIQRTLKRDYYSYSFPKNSPMIDVIDPILVGTLKSMEWSQLIRDYK